MPDTIDRRRLIVGAALSGLASKAFAQAGSPPRAHRRRRGWNRFATSMPAFSTWPITKRDLSTGPPSILLHGFPYDIHSYVDVAPLLAAQGCRVIVPYLRGFGATRFREAATSRSGEQAALGADVIALMDALGIKRAVLAGHNWGGRAACVAAALWPDRCSGSGDGELLSDPGSCPRDGAGQSGLRSLALVRILFPDRARPGRARRQPARDRADIMGRMVAGLGF